MQNSDIQNAKNSIVDFTGLSKDTLHVYVGLAVFLLAALLFRRRLRSLVPWLAVLLVACAGELLDLQDDLIHVGHWQWRASLHDIVNTLFWPTLLLLLARFSRLLGDPREGA